MADKEAPKRKRGAPKGNRAQNRKSKQKEKETVDEYVENPVDKSDKHIETDTMESEITDAEAAEEATETMEESVVENSEEINPPENTPADDFDPLDEAVIERDYTSLGIGLENEKATGREEEIPEPEFTPPPMEKEEDDVPYDAEPIGVAEEGEEEDDEPKNPKYEDLSPAQKRKAANKTADALLKTYCKFVPLPFKKISSFNMDKLERMEMKDLITLGMVVTEDGQTIRGYCDGVNEQVEEVFEVTEDTQDEIREPLVDLLLEQELALTPSQRLMVAVGGHIMQMSISTFQFAMNNKDAIKTFQEFHEDQKRGGGGHDDSDSPDLPPTIPTPDDDGGTEGTETTEEVKEDEHVATEPSMDDYLQSEDVEFEEVEA